MPFRVVEKVHEAGPVEDIARGALTGLTEGVAAVPGFLGDIRDFGEGLARKGFELATGGKGAHPAKLPPLIGGGVPNVVGAVTTAAAKRAGVDPRLARMATAIMGPASLISAPTSAEVQGAMTDDKPLYQPTTRAGKYARAVGQFAPAAAMPGGAARRVANVVLPGVASEAAGQLTQGQPYEPYARVAAAILASGGAHVATNGHPRTRLLAEASRGATDADIARARTLMETAQAEGVQLTMPEAVQQVTAGATGLTRLQRVVEGTPSGAERINPVMSARPGQVRQAVAGYADTIAQPTDQPSMLGSAAQEGADTALTGVRQAINEQARPYYDTLRHQLIGEPLIEPLRANPAYAEAAAQVRAHPVLGPPLEGLEDGSPAFVNEVVKQLDTLAENARPGPMNPGGNNQLASAFQTAAAQARDVMERYVPEWSQARQTVAQGRAANLEPLQRGPLGQIAATDDLGAQTRALYPAAPLEGAPAETAAALQMLGGPASDTARGLTRQHLVNALNEATQNLQGGENQWGGARYAVSVAGNPEQERALMAGVGASGGDTERLRRILEALQATGRRERPGSMTSFNTRDIERLGNAGAAGEALRTGLNPPGAFRRLGVAFQDWQTERNAGRLAEAIVANPADAEAILLHARQVVPAGEGLRAVEQAALAAQLSRQPQLEGR